MANHQVNDGNSLIIIKMRSAKHTEVAHEIGEVARVGDIRHVGALADHFVELLAGSQLFARKHLDLRLVVSALRDMNMQKRYVANE